MIIRITSKQDGFRRCGIAHARQATDYAADRFTAAELDCLKAEPMLVVELLDGKASAQVAGDGSTSSEPSKEAKAPAGAKASAKPVAKKTADKPRAPSNKVAAKAGKDTSASTEQQGGEKGQEQQDQQQGDGE